MTLLAGCTSIEDKEAQVEFERLRRQAAPCERDSAIPDFGTEPPSQQVLRGRDRSDPRV